MDVSVGRPKMMLWFWAMAAWAKSNAETKMSMCLTMVCVLQVDAFDTDSAFLTL